MTSLDVCVVDASVGAKLLVPEDLSDVAERLFAQTAGSGAARQYVPDLFYTECANVLWKYVARHGWSGDDARAKLADLYALSVISIPTSSVVPAALDIALGLSVSVYDACYVATADLMGAPLMTADERLVRRLAGTRYRACFLGDLAP